MPPGEPRDSASRLHRQDRRPLHHARHGRPGHHQARLHRFLRRRDLCRGVGSQRLGSRRSRGLRCGVAAACRLHRLLSLAERAMLEQSPECTQDATTLRADSSWAWQTNDPPTPCPHLRSPRASSADSSLASRPPRARNQPPTRLAGEGAVRSRGRGRSSRARAGAPGVRKEAHQHRDTDDEASPGKPAWRYSRSRSGLYGAKTARVRPSVQRARPVPPSCTGWRVDAPGPASPTAPGRHTQSTTLVAATSCAGTDRGRPPVS